MDITELLRQHEIQPSAQRVAVAEYVLGTKEHPSADQVFARVSAKFPMISRATVYNTLNLFVQKGMLRQHVLTEGRLVFDPNTTPHHHAIDEVTGEILDIPWEAVKIDSTVNVPGFDVHSVDVVIRGRKQV